MRDNGKQFTSKIFKRFLEHNDIKDKPIPKSYPQLQGKVDAYNKIVKNQFLAVEDISSIDDGKLRYEMFVKAYNETRARSHRSGSAASAQRGCDGPGVRQTPDGLVVVAVVCDGVSCSAVPCEASLAAAQAALPVLLEAVQSGGDLAEASRAAVVRAGRMGSATELGEPEGERSAEHAVACRWWRAAAT